MGMGDRSDMGLMTGDCLEISRWDGGLYRVLSWSCYGGWPPKSPNSGGL
jgi:hypothetical protein